MDFEECRLVEAIFDSSSSREDTLPRQDRNPPAPLRRPEHPAPARIFPDPVGPIARRPRVPAAGALLLSAALAVASALVRPALAAPVLEWSDLYEGGASSPDLATAVTCDPEGNLIVGGESADGIYGSDMFIRKLSRTAGAALWSRRVPSGEENDMALTGLALDPFGNVLVGGYVRGCVG
jgi:hypothetical protein